MAKYQELKRHGKLGSLPYRQDVRFVRQRRKEYETDQKILEGKFKTKSVPDFVLRHWDGDGTDEIGVRRGKKFLLDYNGNG